MPLQDTEVHIATVIYLYPHVHLAITREDVVDISCQKQVQSFSYHSPLYLPYTINQEGRYIRTTNHYQKLKL